MDEKIRTIFKKGEKGQAALTFILALMGSMTILVSSLGVLTFNEVKKLNNITKSAQSFYAAEAGIEDALLRVKNQMAYQNPYNLPPVGSASTTVTFTGPLDDLVIVSEGNLQGRVRKVSVNITATPSETDIDFNYGVQVGDGGLVMKSNSQVNGNVYANGPITGPAGGGAGTLPSIIGDAFSAITGGAIGINNLKILESDPGAGDGNGRADRITNVTHDGDVFCVTESGNSPGGCLVDPDPPQPQDLPITDAQINIMKGWAALGGETGTTTISGGDTASLGPIKINGDLILGSNSTLIVTGTIWVTGNITINSNSLVLLSPTYGANNSGTVIADGMISFESNITICGSNGGVLGSCNAENGSYIMFLSTDPSQDENDPAIEADSNILTSILYASAGAIKLNSNVSIKEVTGYKLVLESNAVVTYETGLASVRFSSGPGGTFRINSWQEIP